MSRSSAIFATTDTQLISKIENLPLKDYYVQWTSDVEKVGKQGEAPLKELVNDVISKYKEKVPSVGETNTLEQKRTKFK